MLCAVLCGLLASLFWPMLCDAWLRDDRAGNSIEGIYIQKTREVINGMRSTTGQRDDQWASIAESLKNTVLTRPGAKA